ERRAPPARGPLPARPGAPEGRGRRGRGRARGEDPRQPGRPARPAGAGRPRPGSRRGPGVFGPLPRDRRAALRPLRPEGGQARADGRAQRAGTARPLHVRL
ncbi:MAG: hypothetical protein AVDCRST_MAG12-1301, partial [uncultured Rubrobacteraceae bacterium]